MSLETVELIEHVEVAFGIHVPDSVAPELFTVGRLHEFVLGALRARGEQPDPSLVWERLVRVFVAEHKVSIRLVVPDAHIVYDLGMD